MRMKRATLCLLLATWAGLPSHAVEPGQGQPPGPMRTRTFMLGRGSPGFPALGGDATETLKAAGIELPAGSEAHYENWHRGELVIHSTDQVIAKVIAWLEASARAERRQISVMVAVAEFSLPDASAVAGLTYERARALAGGSWRIIERTAVRAKPGEKSAALYPIPSGPVAGRWSEEFQIEPEIADDESTVSLSFRFDRRAPGGAEPKEYGVEEKVVLRNDEPTLLRATALPGAGGAKTTTVRALIARARIVDERGARPLPPSAAPPSHQQ
jgi:hypothetical protein